MAAGMRNVRNPGGKHLTNPTVWLLITAELMPNALGGAGPAEYGSADRDCATGQREDIHLLPKGNLAPACFEGAVGQPSPRRIITDGPCPGPLGRDVEHGGLRPASGRPCTLRGRRRKHLP